MASEQDFRIWVDADACPAPIREILYRAAERTEVPVLLVANHEIRIPRSRFVKRMQVAKGFDVADDRIAEGLAPGDIVVTSDIPLAAQIVERGAVALSPRGELYTEDNVGERLAVRDLMEELRSTGVQTSGPSALSRADRQAFANQLDRLLTARRR